MQQNVRIYIFALMLVIYEFTTYAANDMIMPGMLQVVREFNAPLNNIADSLTMYLFGAGLLNLFLGPLAEYYGRRRVIISGNILFLVFTLLLALANNIQVFMLARLFQGGCMAFISIGYGIIHQHFNDREALKITSLMGNISILAPLIGPIIGGIIISYFSWRYVFVLSAITGVISLIGLSRFTPTEAIKNVPIKGKSIILAYWQMIKLPQLLIGICANGLIAVPSLTWIAVSPTLVMHTANLSLNHYLVYQVIAIGGLFVSSLVMQFIAGRVSLSKLICFGIFWIVPGLTIGIIFPYFQHPLLWIVIGLASYTFGLGFVSGAIMRSLGTLHTVSQNMLFSLIFFLQTLVMTLTLEIVNPVLSKHNYSLASYALSNFIVGIIAVILVLSFAHLNRHRPAQ